MTIADLVELYLVALGREVPCLPERRIAVRALLARDSESHWWETPWN